MKTIDRSSLQTKIENEPDLKLVEVLEPQRYDGFHLPGAMNVPLGNGFEESIQQAIPNKKAEVVVYCSDEDCHASSNAARKMEQLGYEHVYDYQAGKKDWKEAGLPVR